MARSISYRYEGCPASGSAFLNQPLERPLDFRERSGERRPPRVDDNVPLRPNSDALAPERLAHPPLDAIAHHGASDRARNRKTHPRPAAISRIRARQAERREQRVGKADAVVINRSEIGGAQNPGRPRKPQRAAAGGISWFSRSERLSRR